MSEHNETLADVLAEMRRRIAVKMSDAWYTQDEWRDLCDRIEAAAKRERGNAAAMREALGKIRAELWNNAVIARKKKFALYEIADAALAKPPRNCDRTFIDRPAIYYEFKDWCNAKGHTMEPKLAYDAFDWLLATANEKGATDESK